jgi:hypothetical protein
MFPKCDPYRFSSITVFGFPIFLATFMKKSLKISDTLLGSFTISLFSLKVIELLIFTPLLDKKMFYSWPGFDVQYFIPNSLIASFLRFVNKMKKKSVQKYFYERCAGEPKSSDFWPTIKPFFM